jgi:DUF4097 and DUF4098 domain-containing protein YvlB
MSDQTGSFPANGPIEADIRNESGSVEVIAADTNEVTYTISPGGGRDAEEAAQKTTVEFDHNKLVIRTPRWRFGRSYELDITVGIPTGSSAQVRTASADAECRGTFDRLTVETASGSVDAERVTGDAQLKSASGSIEVDSVAGDAQLRSASGDLTAGAIGRGAAETASGDISLGQVAGDITAGTASGSIQIAALSGPAKLNGVSGDIRVGLATGVSARLNMSSLTGDVRSELLVDDERPAAQGEPIDISARTVSGDITIHSAAAAASN